METKKFFKKKFYVKSALKNPQKRRISTEFFKILISSDLILFILDSRDPIGTFLDLIKKKIQKTNKKLILILNKCDLIPIWLISTWIKIFSHENLIIAFNSTTKSKFGKGTLLNIIRQIKNVYFSKKKNFMIGVLGFPNVGKSSLINSLRGKKVVETSPRAGETKVWQFIKLTKKMFIIDSPGINFYLQKKNILKIIREGFYTRKIIHPKVFEISSILKTIKKLINLNLLGKKNKELTFNIKINSFPKIEKGGKSDKINEINLELKKFSNGYSSWFAPPPRKKTKKNKFFNKKYWFTLSEI
jgi:nuclear GTP-binding protein